MIQTPDYKNHYGSSSQRFLKSMIINFFQSELPKLFGPMLREKLANELVKMIQQIMPEKDHVKPGQLVWNALDVKTRGDSPKRKFQPVILTLVDENDCTRLAEGTKMSIISQDAIARITKEAYAQGALLSMRDIGLFSWRRIGSVSQIRISYEKRQDTILPHTGTLHDMGSCISHKEIIIKKLLLEKKDPKTVARETNHTIKAVERYIKDYRRVETCYRQKPEPEFISQATGIAKFVVSAYIDLIKKLNKKTLKKAKSLLD